MKNKEKNFVILIFFYNFANQSYELMQLDKQIYDEINEYCKFNGLKTRDFIHKLLKDAFMKEKYGDSPFAFNKQPSDLQINDEKKITNEEMDEFIKTTINITEKVQKHVEPLLPTQILSTEVTQVIPQETDVFSQHENLKPKKKRTLK